jgi:hypothetical protein
MSLVCLSAYQAAFLPALGAAELSLPEAMAVESRMEVGQMAESLTALA